MSYAIRNDGQGWRSIDSEDDLLSGEYFSETPLPIPTANPRASEIDLRLYEIDKESVRPLRAFASGTQMDFDVQKLESLEIEAAALRAERATL